MDSFNCVHPSNIELNPCSPTLFVSNFGKYKDVKEEHDLNIEIREVALEVSKFSILIFDKELHSFTSIK